MKIALATSGENLTAKIALHFGKVKNFLIYDTGKKFFKVYSNPEISGKELPPDFLNRLETDAVIAFSLGPMAFEKFKNYNIKMYKAIQGTIAANLQKIEDDKLQELKEEDEDIF